MRFIQKAQLVCAALLIFSLAACSGDSTDSYASPNTQDSNTDSGDTATPTEPDQQSDNYSPSTPEQLHTTEVTFNHVSLSWNASNDNVGVTEYRLYRDGATAPYATSASPSFTDNNVDPARNYSYRVSAVDASNNESSLSATVEVTTPAIPDTSAPARPDGLHTTLITSSQITIAWNASTDDIAVSYYRIYRDGNSMSIGVAAGPTYTDTGLNAEQTYSYRVTAVDSSGNESALSNAVQATTPAPQDTTAPTTPNGLYSTNVTSDRISIAWNASTDDVVVSYYRIYRDGNSMSIGVAASPTYTDTGLNAEQTYSYRVTAVDSSGNESALSNAVQATTPAPQDTTAPTTPNGLHSTDVTSESISIAWNASTDDTGVTRYRIYRDGNPVTTATTTAYTDSGLNAEQTYSYRVSALDEAGNESTLSSALQLTTTAEPDTTAPSTPDGLQSTEVTSDLISIAWNAATDNVEVTHYRVYRDGIQIATSSTTAYTDSGLNAEQTCSYRVSALDAAGNESALSSMLTLNTLASVDTTPPSTPQNLHSTGATSDQIALSWNAATDNTAIAGYRLYRDGSATPVITTDQLSAVDSGLNADQAYAYRVSAIDDAGNESALSSLVSVSTQPISSTQSVTLSWRSPTRYTDGSCLTDVAGYALSYGTSPDNYTTQENLIAGSGDFSCTQVDYDGTCGLAVMSCSYTTPSLESGNWYFVIEAYDDAGMSSAGSNHVSTIVN